PPGKNAGESSGVTIYSNVIYNSVMGKKANTPSLRKSLPEKFRRLAALVDRRLENFLPDREDKYAQAVLEAMRYSLLAPGKRLRPVVTMLSAEVAGARAEEVLQGAAAVEMIHTASLILDDLPCMDNAHLRRGRYALHQHTDEATAVLASNGLLMQGFFLIAQAAAAAGLSAEATAGLVAEAAECVGVAGMVGGQWRDLFPGEKSFEELEYIHSHKTGRLFILAATLGARLAGADDRTTECLAGYAKNLGLAFQIIDDLLDCEAAAEDLGKDTGTDQLKTTFVTVCGEGAAHEVAGELVAAAKGSLEIFGRRGDSLARLADFVYSRKL
ncbi:MAG TPA: polyprenyl synthetase family protein, partial [Candidatus Glassbacteria bacterium]|nr:polyprenyl synthetase family protein [Candidatus Glassbacteria bacterium]